MSTRNRWDRLPAVFRFGEGVDQPRERAVIDAPAGLGRGDRQAYGQVRFADPGRAEQDHVLASIDEAELVQALDLLALDAGLEGRSRTGRGSSPSAAWRSAWRPGAGGCCAARSGRRAAARWPRPPRSCRRRPRRGCRRRPPGRRASSGPPASPAAGRAVSAPGASLQCLRVDAERSPFDLHGHRDVAPRGLRSLPEAETAVGAVGQGDAAPFARRARSGR